MAARREGSTAVRVRVALLGETDDDASLTYDFGNGETLTTTSHNVEYDYGVEAEGQSFVIRVHVGSNEEDGPTGFALVDIPNAEAARELISELAERQRQQDELARKLGWKN